MPQTKSTIRRVKTQASANKRRATQLSELRIAVKKFKVVQATGAENASDLHEATAHALDKAAFEGLIYKNKANHGRGRLAKPAK